MAKDSACDRGWIMIGTAGKIVGHFYRFQASFANAAQFFNSLLDRTLAGLPYRVRKCAEADP